MPRVHTTQRFVALCSRMQNTHAIMLLVAMTTALHTPLSLWLDGRSAPTSAPGLFDRQLLTPDDSAAAAAEPARSERF